MSKDFIMTDQAQSLLTFRLLRGFTSLRKDHKEILKCLGFRRRHQVRIFPQTPEVMGAINKVRYLLVEEKEKQNVS